MQKNVTLQNVKNVTAGTNCCSSREINTSDAEVVQLSIKIDLNCESLNFGLKNFIQYLGMGRIMVRLSDKTKCVPIGYAG